MKGLPQERSELFSKHCFVICTIVILLFGVLVGRGEAEHIVSPPVQEALDGQTYDAIRITSNAQGTLTGVGTLDGGILNVGVEPLTNAGNFTIEKGSLFDADQIGAGVSGSDQYEGLINLGQTLLIKTGGRFLLNKDTLNAQDRTDVPQTDSMRMSGNSFLEAYFSDLIFKNTISIGSSTMTLDGGGTFTFGNKVLIRDSSSVFLTGVTAGHQDLGNGENIGRVAVESNSELTLNNTTLNLVSGNGDASGQNILIKGGGEVKATDSTIAAKKVSSDNTGSLYRQTRGSLITTGFSSGDDGKIELKDTTVTSEYLSINGQLTAENTTLNLSNTPGDPKNFSGTDGQASFTDSTLNIGNGGDIDLMGSMALTALDTDISADLFLMRGTSSASLTSSTQSDLSLNNFKSTGINTLDVTGYDVDIAGLFDIGVEGGSQSQISLTDTTLDAQKARIKSSTDMTANDSQITFRDNGTVDSATLKLNNNSALNFGDLLEVDNSGVLEAQNSFITHKSIGALGNRGNIRISNSSRLDLTDSEVDLTSGVVPGTEQTLSVSSGSTVSAIDTTVKTKKVTSDGIGSVYAQTRGSLITTGLSSGNDGKIELKDTTVTSEYLSVNGQLTAENTTLNLSNTPGDPKNFSGTDGQASFTDSTLNIGNGGDIDLMGSTALTAADTDISADLFLMRGTSSASLTSSTDSDLSLNNFRSTGINTLDVTGYDVDISDSFDIGMEFGSQSQISLTGTALDAQKARIKSSTDMTANDSQITFRDDGTVDSATLKLNNNSALNFGDLLEVDNSGVLEAQNSFITHKSIGATGNRGNIRISNSSRLDLTDSEVDLTSGVVPGTEQTLSVSSGSTVSAIDTTVNTKKVTSDGIGSVYAQTRGSLITTGLSSGNDGKIELKETTVTSEYLSVNGQLTAENTTLNLSNTPGDPKNFSGTDGQASFTNSTLNIGNGGDIDLMGSMALTAADTNISADLFLMRGTSSAALTSSTQSDLSLNDFRSTGTNTLDVTRYNVDIAGLFDIGVENGSDSQITLTNTALDAQNARILKKTTMAANNSQITFRGDGTVNNATLNLNGTSTLTTGNRLLVTDKGSVKADNSTINAKRVVVSNADSELELANSASLTTESLAVTNGGVFIINNSIVHVTGNTTEIITGGQLFINSGSTYIEDGDFIVNGGSLQAGDATIKVGLDMVVSGNATGQIGELIIGDDFSYDPVGTGFFSMDDTRITMLGTSDDEGDGHHFSIGDSSVLGGLSILDSVDLILTQNLRVKDLSLTGIASLDLNGFDLIVSSSFSGDSSQIVTSGGTFTYDPNQTIPEPSTLLLMGFGCLFFLKIRKNS